MLTSVHSTSPAASSRSVVNSGNAKSPWVVHTPSALYLGITCQIGSSMLAIAPSSNVRRVNSADRSICRIPGASAACTSTIAVSVIRTAVRMQDTSSGVLMSFAAPTT